MNSSLVAGFFSGAALIIAIGAQNAFVLRHGLRRQHVLPLVALCAGADALLIFAGVAGLGALVTATPWALDLARYGGALFLLAYGALAARRALRPQALIADTATTSGLGPALLACLGFTFLNPHVYLDTVVLLGSLAAPHGEQGRWVFASGAALASMVWFFSLGYGARWLTPLFARAHTWRVLDGLIALTMFALAASLFMSR